MGGITRFALTNSRVTIVFTLLVAIMGVLIYLDYPRREDPSITIREAIVTARFAGMAPTRVEDLITRPIEEAVREIPEVDEIRSDSRTGVSIIHVGVRDEVTDLEAVWRALRDAMSDVAAELPDGVDGPYVNDDVGLTAVASIALWADGFSLSELNNVAEDLRADLYTLEGVRSVELFGVQDERIFIEMSNARLAEYGVSPGVIVDALRTQNIILPGGVVDASGVNVVIEPSGDFESVDDIADVMFTIPTTGDVARVSDIADVRRTFVDPPERPVFFNGEPAIVLAVSILDGVNSVEFGRRLTRQVEIAENALPIGYVLEFATFQPELVEAAVAGAVNNLYQTLAIVLVVVMVFLGVRTGLIVGAIVPLSMLLAIIVMRLLDIELQRVSIAAMIIALGLLVDNGIVVAEDIRTRLSSGQSRKDAASAAGATLALPLLTSSLTTMLAFLPMLLSVGSAGEYTRSLSQVIIIVLFASWLLAMTATPSMCAWFLPASGSARAPDRQRETHGIAVRVYAGLLRGLLHIRLPFLALMMAGLVGAGILFQGVPKAFFPESDRNQFLVYLDMPAGSSVHETQRVVEGVSRWLDREEDNPEVTSNIAYVGDGGPRFYLSLSPMDPEPHHGFIVVNTASARDVPALVERTREHILETYPEARGRVKPMWMGPSEAGLVEVRISGPDAEHIYERAQAVEAAMRGVPGAINVENDWENPILKLRVEVDQARARRAQVTSEEIAMSLSAFLSGSQVTDYREGDAIIPVVIRGDEDDRAGLSALQSIEVFSVARGVNVPLLQIADIVPEFQFGRIRRLDQVRTVTVRGVHRRMSANDFAAVLQPALDGLDLERGHEWVWGGEIENSAEAIGRLFSTMPYCLAAIVALLIWQFNSFRRPLIILLTIPLSFIGAAAGLVIMQATFGFMAILGLFSLAGIIINNGIVLIDRIDQERAEGASVRDAIVNAAAARLRPIVMTTVTTVLGLLPLILFGGALWYGMANVIAFGLAVGTLLTLGVVPVLYSLFFPEPRTQKSRTEAPAAARAEAR